MKKDAKLGATNKPEPDLKLNPVGGAIANTQQAMIKSNKPLVNN